MPKINEEKKEMKARKTKVVADKKSILDNSNKKGKAAMEEDNKKDKKIKKEIVIKNKEVAKKIAKNLQKQNEKETAQNAVKSKKSDKNAKVSDTKKKTESSKVTKSRKKDKKEDNVTLVEDKKIKKEEKQYLEEYYDLPYRYNETIVKILAQTPKRLFVYWDVSDKDKERYQKAFGEDFFEKTYPVLLIHNEELNYTFEVPINDFANSWYLDIKDSKTKYVVQLGRKFRNTYEINFNKDIIEQEKINLQNDFIYITDSNKLEAPNDKVLFDKIINQITYRNVKTGNEFTKDIQNIVSKLENVYNEPNIKNMYKELYGDEFNNEEFDISNPDSSTMPTSSFK